MNNFILERRANARLFFVIPEINFSVILNEVKNPDDCQR